MPDQATQLQQESSVDLDRLAGDIDKIEAIISGWDEHYLLTARAFKTSIEDLHKEALKRLIRSLKDDPASGVKLREALGDSVVYGVLLYHGLVKEPLQPRVEKALAAVRPMLQGHGGDVELVAIKPPDTVEVRLVGSCHGCPASSQTLTEGIEKSIKEYCPEIKHINQVSRGRPEVETNGDQKLYFISPFATNAKANWLDTCSLFDIPEFGVIERRVKDRSVLLHRQGDMVSCVDNVCAHLGMPLEMGEVRDGILTCPYHGFQYLLETGECMTVPEVQLKVHAVRVVGDKVEVRLEE
ncbi:MAG: Rieske 2Fe-2S domain-containing protein [Acidobacteria bacterium]|nr:Rieske 2Fe-2S domain-containing protein [Acidobacteriota bacterium]